VAYSGIAKRIGKSLVRVHGHVGHASLEENPRKTYTSLDWVRNHWLKCKYNETGEAGLPAAKAKMIMKTTTNTLKELAHIKFVEEYNVGFFLMKLNIGAITP
jgi:hypothetical protein